MSVPNQTPYIIYNANGLTTVFPSSSISSTPAIFRSQSTVPLLPAGIPFQVSGMSAGVMWFSLPHRQAAQWSCWNV
jgi:streptogramin lyase